MAVCMRAGRVHARWPCACALAVCVRAGRVRARCLCVRTLPVCMGAGSQTCSLSSRCAQHSAVLKGLFVAWWSSWSHRKNCRNVPSQISPSGDTNFDFFSTSKPACGPCACARVVCIMLAACFRTAFGAECHEQPPASFVLRLRAVALRPPKDGPLGCLLLGGEFHTCLQILRCDVLFHLSALVLRLVFGVSCRLRVRPCTLCSG